LVQKEDNTANISILFPDKGKYTLRIFAKQQNDKGSYNGVLEFNYVSEQGSNFSFPLIYGTFTNHGCMIKTPTEMPLTLNSQTHFEISAKVQAKYIIFQKDKITEMKTKNGKNYSADVKILSEEVFLGVKTENNITFLCKWNAK
jgi:hypothetical protein